MEVTIALQSNINALQKHMETCGGKLNGREFICKHDNYNEVLLIVLVTSCLATLSFLVVG